MAIFSIPNVRFAGIASAVPKKEVSNLDYKWVSTKDREMLVKTVGVENRRVAEPGTATSDLCVAAADKLIQELGWNRNEIELLIFISQSRDYIIPSTSGIIQDRLGLPHSCVAYDIGLGCSGWVYGVSAMASMMYASKIKKGLLLVGDISTLTASYRDKSTYPLFGDAATATAFELDENASPIHFNLESDGSGYDAIIIPDGGMRNFISKKSFDYKKHGEGIYRNRLQIALNGIEVFNFALREVTPNMKRLLQELSKSTADFDYFVFHQANLLMNETIRKMMKLEKEKVPYTIRKFGNTSSASIPLTITTQLKDSISNGKARLFTCGFGVGLSWGSVAIEADHIVCPDLIEY
ncbi:MAG: ketoacyl-ACP synthase III [Bacteroidales bacterium]|nr:ketoacyl-ACP synthase III [Bacteroidales bacterium]